MHGTGSLPETLRSLRRARGLSVRELAQRAAVSASSLQGWESGRQTPKGRSLGQVLDALEAPDRVRAQLIAFADPAYARFALAKTPLGPPLAVGTVLQAMRARRGMTQAELARALGVTQGAVAKWENGDSTPTTEMLHATGFALGATVEETIALTSARGAEWGGTEWEGGRPDELPPEPGPLPFPHHLSLDLQEMVFFSQEAKLWRRAASDPHWEPVLCNVLAYRANLYVLNGRFAEAATVAERALRLATTTEGRTMAVPAVNALIEVGLRQGEGPERAARTCGLWAERLPDSTYKAWMVGSQGLNLIRTGRTKAGLDLVVRSRDMDDAAGTSPDSEAAQQCRAQSMTEAFLEARMPAEAYEALAPFRRHDSYQILYARVEHANGRPLDEPSLAYLRHRMRDVPGKRSWKNLRLLRRIERMQARLTGASRLSDPPLDADPRALWAAIPGGDPWVGE